MPFSATRDLWLVLKAQNEGSRAMRAFSRDIRMVGATVSQANMQAARSALTNQLAQQKVSRASQAVQLATLAQIAALDKQIAASRVSRSAMEEHRVSAQRFSSAMTGAATSLGALGIGFTAIGAVGVFTMRNFVNFAAAYEKQTALTRTQVDGLRYSVKELGDAGLRIAKTVPVAFEQIQPALFDIFSSLEIGLPQAEKLLTSFAKAAVAGGTDITSVSRATIGFLNAFHLPLTDVNHLLDVQFQLVQEGIGTYDEWVKRLGLATPSAARYGQTIEMLSAALAASTRMGITAARSTTAVSRAMDALSNPKAVKELKKLGVSALDAKGNFRPMIDVLKEFRTVLMKMPKGERIAKLLDVFKGAGGTIEARRFLQNMLLLPGNIELMESIFKEMTTTAGSFEAAYGVMANTVANKTQQLKNNWSILKVTLGEALTPAFLKIIEVIQKGVTWFNNLSAPVKRTVAVVLIVTSIILGLVGVFLLIIGGIAGFISVITIAGSSLFTFLGILAGAGVLFAALGVALFMARDWIKTAAAEIWQKLAPGLTALWAVIKEKVIPVLKDLSEFFMSKAIPAIKEVANWVKTRIINAFKKLSDFIKNAVIPIIGKLTEFYHKHEGTIKQLVGWLITFGKWIAKIGAFVGIYLVALFVGPVVIAIVAVIAAFIGLVMLIIKIIEWVKMLIHWFSNFGSHMSVVGQFFVGVWNSIASFFIDLWDRLVGYVMIAWNAIVAFLMPALNFLRTIWESFWSVFGGLIKAVWGLILAIINLAWVSIMFVILHALNGLKIIWNTVWGGIKDFFIMVWNAILTYIKQRLEILKAVWNAAWGFVKNVVVTVWNAVFAFVRARLNDVMAFIRFIWGLIGGQTTSAWNTIYNTIAGALGRAWAEVQRIFNIIRNFFSGAINWLRDAGANIIQGLINGITSKISAVTDKINSIARTIRERWPGSPVKAGPLSRAGSPFIGGQKIVNMLAAGMASRMNAIGRMANMLAGESALSIGGVGGGTTVNQNLTVYTNEINPRRHSEELGFLLGGRI